MERDLNNDEFEIFLKQKVDQHRLYPSDKAWKGIFHSLHPGMKWFKVGGSLLLIGSIFFVSQQTSLFRKPLSSLNQSVLPAKDTEKANGSVNASIPLTNSVVAAQKALPAGAANGTVSPFNNVTPTDVSPMLANEPVLAAKEANEKIPGAARPGAADLNGYLLHNIKPAKLNLAFHVGIPRSKTSVSSSSSIAASSVEADLVSNINESAAVKAAVIGSTIANEEEISIKDFNWLQEMAAIKLTPRKKSKFNLQFTFSPTVSYRRLSDNQNSTHSSLFNSQTIARDQNINRYVDHIPAIGAELGSNILFSATRNFTLKTGLQLNYSRYNIKAFRYTYEKASIALHTSGPIADTLSSYTALRNFSGYAPEELQNQYLQVSVPIGAELKLLGNKRLQLNVAGTIQPTFLLFSDTYLLSTNYLNYTKEPSLVRKWNVHSSFEAFLSYKTGGLRWQLGPQFRYQLLSSFNDRYPIKEYLLEYGVKIGVSKTLR